MSNRDSLALVEDMIEAIDKIIRYLDTADGLAAFLQNEMAIDAVTRNYEIIGEAANQISKAIQGQVSGTPLETNVWPKKLCST